MRELIGAAWDGQASHTPMRAHGGLQARIADRLIELAAQLAAGLTSRLAAGC